MLKTFSFWWDFSIVKRGLVYLPLVSCFLPSNVGKSYNSNMRWKRRIKLPGESLPSFNLSGDYVIDINPCEKCMGEDITWLSCPFLAGCEMSCWIHPFLSWVIGSCRTRDCPRASSMLSQCSPTVVYPLSYFYFDLTESYWAAQASREVNSFLHLLSTRDYSPSSKARPRSVVSYYSHLFSQHCRGVKTFRDCSLPLRYIPSPVLCLLYTCNLPT